MRRITVVAMGLLCLIALKPSSLVAGEKSVESSKADSGLRFLESGKGRSGVGEPSAVRAAAATSRASGLTAPDASPQARGSLQGSVPAPAAAQKEASATSASWSKRRIGSAIVGGFAGAFLWIPAVGSGMPVAAVVLGAGIIVAVGAGIGYGLAALAERKD